MINEGNNTKYDDIQRGNNKGTIKQHERAPHRGPRGPERMYS